MPNQRRTGVNVHSFSVDDALWSEAMTEAKRRETTVSAVIREALRRFVAGEEF